MRTRHRARRLILTALAVSAGLACGTPDASDADGEATSALLVRADAVKRSEGYVVRESYAGRVASRRSSDLGFDRAARVVTISVDEGDRVDEGALLARLETRDLRAEPTADGVRLVWQPPAAAPAGTSPPDDRAQQEAAARYNVYRAPAGERWPERPLNATPLEDHRFFRQQVHGAIGIARGKGRVILVDHSAHGGLIGILGKQARRRYAERACWTRPKACRASTSSNSSLAKGLAR